jgi:hypothetical protein
VKRLPTRALPPALPPAAALVSLALALLAQLFFARGPRSVGEGLICAVAAVTCFLLANWLQELVSAQPAKPRRPAPVRSASSTGPPIRTVDDEDPWLRP